MKLITYNGQEIDIRVTDAYDDLDAKCVTPHTEWEPVEIQVDVHTDRRKALEYLCEKLDDMDDGNYDTIWLTIEDRKNYDPDIIRAIDNFNGLIDNWKKLKEETNGNL